jgi:hypothetical protein
MYECQCFIDRGKRHTFRASLADLDGISPQRDTQVDLVALVQHFLVVFLEHYRLFHERTDGRIDAVVVGWVGHVSIFEVCMQPCYELQKDEADLWMMTYVLECVRRYRCTYWSSSLIYASVIMDCCGPFSVFTGWPRMEDMQQSRPKLTSSRWNAVGTKHRHGHCVRPGLQEHTIRAKAFTR